MNRTKKRTRDEKVFVLRAKYGDKVYNDFDFLKKLARGKKAT